MPSLKELNCSIELSDDQEPLQELGTVYGDAFVETFIPVPKKQRTFTVHLSSRDFIAPGIAMYVFIDGVYQCNRNRQNMKLRKPLDRRSLVDFKVRQKEEKLKDGSMVAREWTFEKLDHASADGAPHSCSPNILENIGCIEVVVLRCAGPRNAKTAANMNLDGANDYPDYRFDRDSRSRTTAYDDRNPFLSAASKYGPPPRITSYRSPCAETVRSRELPKRAYSRYSESVSPGKHPQRDTPAPAFQYGSGPLPSHSNARTHRGFLDEAKGSGVLRTASTVDPSMLKKIVADAVKRGVEESMKNDVSNGRRTVSREDQRDVDSSSQVPGAWPTSPTHRSKHHQHRLAPSKRHDRDDHREDRDLVWEHRPTRSRAETRVAWDEGLEWDKQSRGDGWCSPEDNLADSWDIEETWSEKQPHDWEGVRHRSRSCGRVTRSPSRSRRVSYISSRTADRQRSRHGRSHRPRSRSHSQWVNDSKSSSDDTDGWICIEAPSDSSNSLERSDSTLKPSHSRSQVQPSRNKSGRRSSRRQSSQTRHGHRLSQLVGNPQWHPESVYYARPPSVLVTNASTMMSAPISQYPADVRSRKQSIYTWPTASVVAPPPTWGCASEKVRRNSAAMTCLPPAPFSTTGVEHHESRNYSGSSSWGVTQDTSRNKEVKKSSPQQSIWGEDKKSDKTQRAWGEADNKSTDWSPDQEQEWGDDSAAEINGGGWISTEKDSNGWDTSKDTKEVAVDGWNTDNSNDTWRQDDVKDAEAGSWNAENNDQGWGLNDTSKDEQDPTGGGFEDGDANNNGWNTEQNNDTSWNQPQDTTNDAPFNPDTGWIAAPVVEEKAERKAKSPSTSKRHTSKSLSKYRQLSAPSTEAKPHWQFPPPSSKKTLRSLIEDQASEQSDTTRRIPSAPSEPLYKIPRSVAEEKGVRYQVLAGPGTRYGHAISRPEYIDRLDKPYAVFRFKYRSRSMLRSMFGNDCLSKTGTAMVPVQKEDLEALPQSELIRKMLALQCRLEEKEGEKGGDGETGSQCTESVAMDRAEKWVTQHSREASERGKKKKAESEKSRAKSAEKVAGWDDGEAMKWNGKEVRW